MNQYCVIVANGTKTRFFTLEDSEFPEIESSPTLVETNTVVHPDHDAHHAKSPRAEELNVSAKAQKPGYSKAASQAHDRRYVKNIANEASKLNQAQHISALVLVSQKRMLGDLRSAMKNKLQGVNTLELAKDLSKLSPWELHNYLAKEKLLPERKKPTHTH